MNRPSKYGFIFLILTYVTISFGYGQEILINDTISKDILYYKNRGYGILAHNRGYGLYYTFGKNTSAFRSSRWEFTLQTLKHFKEVKNSENIAYYTGASPFKYGKINDVIVLSSHRTIDRLITDMPYWGGIEIRYFYGVGLSLALAKPKYYYIITEIVPVNNGWTYNYEIMQFHKGVAATDIIAPAGFFTGLNKTKVYPGITLKSGFTFDHSKNKQNIRKLIIGASLDIYPIPLPIMFQYKAEYLIPGFNITYVFGSNYN